MTFTRTISSGALYCFYPHWYNVTISLHCPAISPCLSYVTHCVIASWRHTLDVIASLPNFLKNAFSSNDCDVTRYVILPWRQIIDVTVPSYTPKPWYLSQRNTIATFQSCDVIRRFWRHNSEGWRDLLHRTTCKYLWNKLRSRHWICCLYLVFQIDIITAIIYTFWDHFSSRQTRFWPNFSVYIFKKRLARFVNTVYLKTVKHGKHNKVVKIYVQIQLSK